MESMGQGLVDRLEKFFRSFIVFPEQTEACSLVLAVWAINTWIYQVWTSTPYLSIQAATPGAGKSALLECVAAVSKSAEVVAEPTQASLFRLADSHQGWMTLCYDDAQKLGKPQAASLLGVLLPGYRRGATVPRSAPGGEGVIKYPVYWPKAFSLIGDLVGPLRGRSIVIHLERATRARMEACKVERYRADTAIARASAITPLIEAWMKSIQGEGSLPVVDATWVDGREEELWSPLWSTAHLLKLDAATMKRFRMISADLSSLKTQDAVFYTNAQAAEDAARDVAYGERAMRDLVKVLREGEPAIFSTVAVQRMRALVDGPWRTFRGQGLTENRLADLVARFNVAPTVVRMEAGRAARKARGYSAKAVKAALREE